MYPGQEHNNIEIYKKLDAETSEEIAKKMDVMCPVCLFNFEPYHQHDETQERLNIVVSSIEKVL